MNDDKLLELKKHYWWMIPLTLIAVLLLVTRLDPIGDWLGPQAERVAQLLITLAVIGYIVYLAIRKK